ETRQDAAAALSAELTTLRARLGGLDHDVQARQAERVGSEKDIEQAVREHERVHRHLETLGSEIRQVELEAQATVALLERLEERERTDASARDVAVERDRLEAEARGAGQGHQTLLDELTTIEAELRGVQAELSRAVAAIHDVELRATEGRVRREELGQDAWRT